MRAPLLAALLLASCGALPASETAPDAGSGPLGATVQQRACLLIGGLDRIVLKQADFPGKTCIHVRLVRPPVGEGAQDVELPEGWSVEGVIGSGDPAQCIPGVQATSWRATAVRGHVRWQLPEGAFAPTEAEVDLVITGNDGATHAFRSARLEVEGSCP